MTHGEIIILRLLKTRSYYGYQLDTIIEENRMREWADIGFSSIYSMLNKLEKKGYVQSHFEKVHGSPKRKVYEPTEKGLEELRNDVIRMLKTPQERHDDFTVAMVVSDILSETDFEGCLREYKEHLVRQLSELEYRLPESARNKEQVALAIDRLNHLVKAELRWIKEL